MALTLEGKVKSVGQEESGEGKNGTWKKREFVIEYPDGNYPKLAAFTGMKEKADQIAQLQVGQNVRVYFSVNSREYNGKVYTNLDLWKYETIGGSTASAPSHSSQAATPNNVETNGIDSDLPF